MHIFYVKPKMIINLKQLEFFFYVKWKKNKTTNAKRTS